VPVELLAHQMGDMARDERQVVDRESSILAAGGFTLVELLVVVGVLALLLGVLVPALAQARRAARSLVGASRQRQVVLAVNLYATDHEGRYPESVATAAMLGRTWRWQEPRMMKACSPRADNYRCSMAAYLRSYLPKAVILSCPSSPRTYNYAEESWRAGEQWDNPDTSYTDDSVQSSFCFYWNYIGYLPEQERPFVGPQTDDGRRKGSTLLIGDYFGFNHWRSPEAFGSCERLPHAQVAAETSSAPPFWSQVLRRRMDQTNIQIKLRAGFVDGHVETYRPADTAILEVADNLDGTTPAFSGLGVGAGEFYIPRDAIGRRP